MDVTRTHKYTVTVQPFGQPQEEYTHDTLETACREWDRRTFALATSTPSVRYEGGIAIRSYISLADARRVLRPDQIQDFKDSDAPDTPVCVRDGWILHLWDGHAYLNPRLTLG